MIKIASVIGARPQFVKAVSISRAIREFNRTSKLKAPPIKEIVIHTGQHYDYNMNDIFFKELRLKRPDYNLNVGSHAQGKQTALMLERIEGVLIKEKPDLVLVYGDTNSTLAASLAAKKLKMLTAHVEAGLRSYNMAMPEEINRLVTDRISDILFCPSMTAVKNLCLEGIKHSGGGGFPKVFQTGDVMRDSIKLYFDIAQKRSKILEKLSLKRKKYFLATVHRAENTDNDTRLMDILYSLIDVAKNIAPVVFPMHPRTKNAIASLKRKPNTGPLNIINPVSYLDMLVLEKNARAILTDSGGMQKEAFYLRTPCVTLRDETEWVETVKSGYNVLAGTDKVKIIRALKHPPKASKSNSDFYGSGEAAKKIVAAIARLSWKKKL